MLNEFRRLAGMPLLTEMEMADNYSERVSMKQDYDENLEGFIKRINSLLNRQVRRKGIPSDLGFAPNKPLEGDVALFSSPELLIDVAINDSFGFDVYYSQHVDGEDFDTIYGDSDEYSGGQPMRYTRDRMEMDTVADNVSFDQALIKVGELIGNSVSEETEVVEADENMGGDVVAQLVKDFSNPEVLKQVYDVAKRQIVAHLDDATVGIEYSDGPGEGGGMDFHVSYPLEFATELTIDTADGHVYEFLPEAESVCHQHNDAGESCQLKGITIPFMVFYDNNDNDIELTPSSDERIQKVFNKIESIIEKAYEFLTTNKEISKIYADGRDDYRDDYERYGVSRSDFI